MDGGDGLAVGHAEREEASCRLYMEGIAVLLCRFFPDGLRPITCGTIHFMLKPNNGEAQNSQKGRETYHVAFNVKEPVYTHHILIRIIEGQNSRDKRKHILL